MSGDVQPRKRKDKKRKKDELGIGTEETSRGTAATLGDGDVFMHSHHDHGTGGHWCAKVIFFSLLAVLLTLIGLIILENRGLSELEANSVESRYSGVLEGWLEDAPDDDHHDEHTLELKHHDDEDGHDIRDDEINQEDDDEDGHNDDDEHDDETDDEDENDDESDEDENDDENNDGGENDDEHGVDGEDDDDEPDEERDMDTAEEEDQDERPFYKKFFGRDERHNDDDNEQDDDTDNNNDDQEQNEDHEQDYDKDNDDDDQKQNKEYFSNDLDDHAQDDDNDDEQNVEKYDGDDDEFDEDSLEAHADEDEEEHEDEEEDESAEIEVERIEKEASEEEPISLELPTLPEDDDDDNDDDDVSANTDKEDDDDDADNTADDDDDDFLEADDEPLMTVERITAPAGKPFLEVEEDEVSSEMPPATLEEEEEYEKQQEELRREEEQASHVWLKLVVGAALLLATHAVMRRATAPRDTSESDEHVTREETPLSDRRMTLIAEESSVPVTTKKIQESTKPVVEEVRKNISAVGKSLPPPERDSEDEQEPEIEEVEVEDEKEEIEKDQLKELYSDEEDEDEEIIDKKIEALKHVAPLPRKAPEPEEKEDEVLGDVEIIEDEAVEEELDEEVEDEEEISDVDDAELLTRLEAKYGRLPEPERPGQRHKDGGNSVDDEWAGEPSDPFWRQQLDSIERELRQGAWLKAAERAGAPELRASARARYLAATALDRAADAQRDNRLLSRAIAAYLELLKMNERLSNKKLIEVASRALDRIHFRGNYLSAEPVYRLLIRRFPDNPEYRNNLTVSFLMANRGDLAEKVLKETLLRWPNNRVALAHYGFVLKTEHNRLEEAVEAFRKALEGDNGPACEPRYYYHQGDALLQLGRYPEAHEVHKRGAKLGHFLSPAQRSLYNVPRLRGQPWWNVEETPYSNLALALEKSWRDILREAEAVRASYEQEKEGLKERGEWSQLDLFVRGREVPERCKRAPVTCSVVRTEVAAAGCRRGQVKFSAMEPGTHVRPHVGPTNCRLRMHLGLSNTKDTYIRVDQEVRQWQEGKVLIFDDSFEHEVWHNGTRRRLVLIVDVWHPDLTPLERRSLSAI